MTASTAVVVVDDDDDGLVGRVAAFVRDWMAQQDASHGFDHVERVLRLALHIQARTPSTSRRLVALAALLHDVGDAKYLRPGEDGTRLAADVLRSLGAAVQAVCLGVSYAAEVRRPPAAAAARLAAHPELAVVQDADRLDALGAARAFAFAAARRRSLRSTLDHFDDKLLRLEAMMKTPEGRALARQRTQRLRLLRAWWHDEADGHGLDPLRLPAAPDAAARGDEPEARRSLG